MKALCLKDFGTPETNYATLVEKGIKTLETRTWGTKFRGDLLITCSKSSKSENAGKAVCVVEITDCRDMTDADEIEACISLYPKAKVWEMQNLRWLSEKFEVKSQLSIFDVEIPKNVLIIPF